MPSATFDGVNQIVQLPSAGSFDVEKDLYSAWKVWLQESDNAKYLPAFETTGGDPVGGGQSIAPYFFCRNDLGWRIKMPAANGDITLTGNLFARDPATALFQTNTGYDAFLRLSTSTQALTVAETDYTQTLSDIKASTNLIPALL